MSHLDGELLLRLPQLHAIQLAGSNPWRCDCRLRKLVRNLMTRSMKGNALGDASQAATSHGGAQKKTSDLYSAAAISDNSGQSEELHRANILQDEPSCEPSLAAGSQRTVGKHDRDRADLTDSIVRASNNGDSCSSCSSSKESAENNNNNDSGQLAKKKMGRQNAASQAAAKRLWKSMSKYKDSKRSTNDDLLLQREWRPQLRD